MTDELQHTPLVAEHRRAGARLLPFAGWLMPIQYQSGIVAEHRAVRERAGLFDVSHMGELGFTGAGAVAAVNRLITNDLERVADGQALYTCCCNEAGGVLDDLIVYRHSPERVVVVCNASNRNKIVGHFTKHATGGVELVDESDATALIALQGPRAFEVLDAAGTEPGRIGDALSSFRFLRANVAGVRSVVARTGYTGEDGVELFCAAERAADAWSALLDAGKPLGLEPVGLGARDTLRLEARLALYGNDIDETTNPIEAGLGWTVKLDKPEFLGKSAIRAVKAAGPARKLVGFRMVGRGIARHGYALLDTAERRIGVCTSGGPSPTLGINIGLGYVPSEIAEVGGELVVDCRGKPVPAKIVETPFYKRRKSG